MLIIEDEPFFAMDLQTLLEMEGATSFDLVDTHADAVTAALIQRPAVITSDVHLIEGHGPDAVAAIRGLIGWVPVIFITACPSDCGPMHDADALLCKPLDRKALRTEFQKRRPETVGAAGS